jgi:hypothetical protein
MEQSLSVLISENFKGDNVHVTVELGLYDSFQTVAYRRSLCGSNFTVTRSMNVTQLVTSDFSNQTTGSSIGGSDNNGNQVFSNASDTNVRYTCPYPGQYHVKTYYKLPSIPDRELHYTPEVRMLFSVVRTTNASNLSLAKRYTLMGCANAGTMANHHTKDERAMQGLLALGVATATFMLIFAILLYLTYRRRKWLQQLTEQAKMSEHQPYHPQQRYQYFRTLPNGTVIPLAGRQSSSRASPSLSLPSTRTSHRDFPPPRRGSTRSGSHRQQHNATSRSDNTFTNEHHGNSLPPATVVVSSTHGRSSVSPIDFHRNTIHEGDESTMEDMDSDAESNNNNKKNHPSYRSHHPTHDLMTLTTNPSYNETVLPTRPII